MGPLRRHWLKRWPTCRDPFRSALRAYVAPSVSLRPSAIGLVTRNRAGSGEWLSYARAKRVLSHVVSGSGRVSVQVAVYPCSFYWRFALTALRHFLGRITASTCPACAPSGHAALRAAALLLCC